MSLNEPLQILAEVTGSSHHTQPAIPVLSGRDMHTQQPTPAKIKND